jgi:PAS domain S-box-containing protein
VSGDHAGLLREAFFNGNGVAKKLIVALVLFSSVITALITAVELYTTYRHDLGQIDRSIDFIGKSYLPALTDAVWVADREQVQTQIDGLLRLPDLEYIGIAVDGATRWSAGQAVSQRTVGADIPLLRQHRGQALTIGSVRVVASVDRVLARLWDQLLLILLSNAVKTLLVAGFMLLVFQYLVTRHLTRIAAFVRRIDPAAPRGEQVQLDRPPGGRWRPDILDAVTASLNGLSASLGAAFSRLRESDERLRALTRESSAYIYELDAQGRISFANRTYAGLTRAQVEGSRLVDWFPADLRPSIGRALAAAFDSATVQRLEYTIPDPAGEPRSYLASITPIERDGTVAKAVLTALDISDLKAAEQQIRELNAGLEARVHERTAQLQQATERAEAASRAKSEFLSRMSHELRTPMNAILGFAQLIEMSDPSPRQLKWAAEIRRAGDHLLEMIEELLDLARIEVGKMAITVEPVELPPLIDECAAIVQPLIAARGLEVTREAPCADARVMADRLRLRQVLVNLLSNAVKYNREHGAIHIRCEPHADRLRLSVADRGAGLAPEQLARLFQPFERLGAERGDVEGTGIGLALSKQLAELMGATLGADSVVGEGSVFWIDLPLADGASAPAVAGAVAAPAARVEPHCDLLYIEDSAPNVELVAAFLARHPGVRLRTASSGGAGLALARERRPDIVLLDIHLPDMDGHQVLQAMRGDAGLHDVAVIALSADAMPHDVQRGLAAGIDRYLAKPLDLQVLLRSIDEVLRTRSRRPERF